MCTPAWAAAPSLPPTALPTQVSATLPMPATTSPASTDITDASTRASSPSTCPMLPCPPAEIMINSGRYKSNVHAANINEIQDYKRNITFRDCDFFTYSRNLFDNNITRTPIEVGYLNYNDFTWITDSTVFTSDYIPVKYSDYIKVSSHTNGTKGNLASIIFYDNNKKIIGTISDSMASNNIVSTAIPANCRYIRFSDMLANVDTDMCTYDGGDMSTFVAYIVPTISV